MQFKEILIITIFLIIIFQEIPSIFMTHLGGLTQGCTNFEKIIKVVCQNEKRGVITQFQIKY